MRPRSIACALLALALGPLRAEAWPADLSERIARDALRLLPRSLAEAFLANEVEIFANARISGMPALPLLYQDVQKGRLGEPSQTALAQEFAERVKALQGRDFRAAVIALGVTYRLAVDLADPAVGAGLGDDVKARAIRREFYAFVTANLDKIPVVVVAPESMRLALPQVPAFLDAVVARTPAQGARLREEGQEAGRVLAAREIDFRSPVFAVASTAYSRSVSAVAATWIAIWRSAGGDMQRTPSPRLIKPRPTIFHQQE
jgi:hypothetical protein